MNPSPIRRSLLLTLRVLLVLVVGKTIATTLANWPSYFPPDFRSDFLLGRESYFFNGYQGAFYTHIVAGPLTLGLGLVLLSETFRRRWPGRHRQLGKLQAMLILFVVAPSGLWMAYYAATGAIAGAGLATLAILTAATTALGWRAAVNRRVAEHRRWMQRSYVLLCSAVVIRAIGGAAEVAGVEGTYPYAVGISWLAPLAILELWRISSPLALRHQQSSASPAAPPAQYLVGLRRHAHQQTPQD
jgi:uncharacterized membrane protein